MPGVRVLVPTRESSVSSPRVARLVAALALPLTLVAAACAPQAANSGGGNVQPSAVSSDVASAGPVTLRFLDFEEGPDAAYIKKAIAGFEQQYPNVKIERTEQSFDQVMSTLNLRLADPNGPDVATINNGWQSMGTLSKAGLILNLDKYAELYGWRDQLSPTMLRQLEFTPDGKKMGEGSLYGTPGARLTTVGLYYNKKLLTDAGVAVPTTYAEFETALAAVKAKGETPIALGTQEKTYATNPLFALQSLLGSPKAINDFVYGSGGTTLEQTGLGTAAAKLAEWQKDGYLNPGYNGLDFDGGKKVFTDGKAAFHFDYSGALVGTGADSTKFGRVQLPQPDGGAQTSVGAASAVFGISAKTKNPDAAAAFLNYLGSQEMNDLSVQNGYLPIRPSTAQVEPGTTFADEVAGAATVTKDDGFLPFFDWSSPEMLDVIGGQVQLILAGRSTPETLVTDGQKSYDDAAAKRG
nr:extracellular solute-binding protein [Microlunatus antarcticus]